MGLRLQDAEQAGFFDGLGAVVRLQFSIDGFNVIADRIQRDK